MRCGQKYDSDDRTPFLGRYVLFLSHPPTNLNLIVFLGVGGAAPLTGITLFYLCRAAINNFKVGGGVLTDLFLPEERGLPRSVP